MSVTTKTDRKSDGILPQHLHGTPVIFTHFFGMGTGVWHKVLRVRGWRAKWAAWKYIHPRVRVRVGVSAAVTVMGVVRAGTGSIGFSTRRS